MARQDLHNYPDEYYYPEALKSGVLTDEEMRAEYSHLRRIANSRLEKLGNSEFNKTQAYLRNRGKFIPLSEIKSERELIHKLYEVKKFTSSRSGSVTGQKAIRNQAIETAQERGLYFINRRNIQAFGDFMEQARQRGYSKIYGSERIADLFGTASNLNIKPETILEEFNYYMENKKALEQQPKIQSEKSLSADVYKRRIEADKKESEHRKKKR